MRLLITADLHFNHRRSAHLAEELISQINDAGPDVLLLIGDTATSEGDALERCLSRFNFRGPKVFVAGNHELWTTGPDSYQLFTHELPRRVRALGWQWLETEPFVAGDVAIVGSIGWYDYSFADRRLHVPRRFYEQKISPGAAAASRDFRHLVEQSDDIPPDALRIIARWNDGRYVKLHRRDEHFLDELLARLRQHLDTLQHVPTIIAAIHHLPFRQLLPPLHNIHWDFARAFLGSDRTGELLLRYPNIRHVLCGHSHFPATAQIAHIEATSIGSGYRRKTFRVVEVKGVVHATTHRRTAN